ncbi:MAG: SNF2-related protein [Candidatus Ornithomonoglobus sp.]
MAAIGSFAVEVKGSKTYTVTLSLDADGNVTEIDCNCPYDRGAYCKHMAAALLAVKDNKDQLMGTSSREVGYLLQYYSSNAAGEALNNVSDERVRIAPELEYGEYNNLSFILKIGKERGRAYIVKNIETMYSNFENRATERYGKELTFHHDWDAVDEKSRRVVNLAMNIYKTSGYGYEYSFYDKKRTHELNKRWIDDFFELYCDEYISFSGEQYYIKSENPELHLNIAVNSSGRYYIELDKEFVYCGSGRHAYFFSNRQKQFYICDVKYTRMVCGLCEAFRKRKQICISNSDMPAFYNAVIKPLIPYIDIEGLDLVEQYAPPELETRLYVDAPDKDMITARLEFVYDGKNYAAFYKKSENPYCDYSGETAAEQTVKQYFDYRHYLPEPLVIEGDEKIYRFMTEGLDRLSELMDVYASEKFKRINVRPPAHPVVGVRTESNLLALDITAKGYTIEELVEGLKSYRMGKKYHRLKDGSFMTVDNGLRELAELTENLNITDKALLKENIRLPQYRMLYLNGIQNDTDGMRIARNSEFKRLIKQYNALMDESQSWEIPAEVEPVMREYQKYGSIWMKTIAAYGFGGILADDMGLGKTLQAISLMLDMKAANKGHGRFLVVCPSSLALNWESEIRKFAPSLSAVTIAGTVSERNEYINMIDEYDVVITSYQTLIRDISKYENMSFDLHFIDEAQYIKNHGTQMAKAVKGVKSKVRFALTGTPVENSLAELWSIFDFIMPGYLHAYTYFKKTYETPIVKRHNNNTVRALQRLTSPFILRRLKKEVLTELPDKTETVMKAKMEPEQSKIYSATVIETKQLLSSSGGSGEDKLRILAMLTRLRQLCCDPSLVYENYTGTSAKLEMCMELIESCMNAGHKILLFSQFTSMLDIIAKNLSERGISYYTLTGKTKPKERLRMVNSFNADDTKLFLISLKAGGTGLNLTGADIVIHYDPWWNVSAENQASDRVYRIGQKRNVQIYKLIAEKSIEERIIELQQHKEALSDIALNGEGDIMKMSADDIMSILE